MHAVISILIWTSVLAFVQSAPQGAVNNSHNKIDTWCGKAYKSGDPAIDPGGRIDPPTLSKIPLLDLKIQQKQAPYLASDDLGSFVVDTSLSYIHGQPYPQASYLATDELVARQLGLYSVANASQLSFQISRSDSGAKIASGHIALNATDNEVKFALNEFPARGEPYGIEVVIQGSSCLYTAQTRLLRLPDPTDGRTVTKIDHLYGSLLIQENGAWAPLFPYSFYIASWEADPPKLADFAKRGYNVLHVVADYNWDWFDNVADEAERLGLWIMYDMRGTYQSTDAVTQQVQRYMKRKNFLLWYTADEPDGNVNPTDAPKKSYDLIKSLDPYHPVSLVLNCANYYFEQYSAGADILLSDVYPIGTNTQFSVNKWHTVCNTTYGDCGCDNCYGQDDLTNIPARLDQMQAFQTQLGQPQKPLWGVPQAFGNQDYWTRMPTNDEEMAMTMLGINHGAKGIVMWTWPTTPALIDVTSKIANVLINDCTELLLTAKLLRPLQITPGGNGVDASAWVGNDEILLSIVNPSHQAQNGTITVHLAPSLALSDSVQSLWGTAWTKSGASSLTKQGMPALGVDLFKIKITGSAAIAAVVNMSTEATM